MIDKSIIVKKFEYQRMLTPDMNVSVEFGNTGEINAVGVKGRLDKDRIGDYEGMIPKILQVAVFVDADVSGVESNTYATIDDVKYLVGPMIIDPMGALRSIHFLDKDYTA